MEVKSDENHEKQNMWDKDSCLANCRIKYIILMTLYAAGYISLSWYIVKTVKSSTFVSKMEQTGPENNLYICLSEQLKLLEVQLADTFKGSSPSLAQIMTWALERWRRSWVKGHHELAPYFWVWSEKLSSRWPINTFFSCKSKICKPGYDKKRPTKCAGCTDHPCCLVEPVKG